MKRPYWLILLLVTACGGGRPESFGGTAGIVHEEAADTEAARLVRVEVGRHAGFDRLVFEFAGPRLPGYHIEYIDRPVRACGSGKVVPLPGDGWLEVRFAPAQAHTEQGEPTAPARLRRELVVLKELARTCDFEGRVNYVAGLESPNRYRVTELSDPRRLVVDIRH